MLNDQTTNATRLELEMRMLEIISVLFDVRTDSDHDVFFMISEADTAAQIENAAYFVDRIVVYLKSK